jgi:tRNA/tmRNA/rRNA uracil-C5-methylase (TrmA/RlmC/RlmD family)
MLVQTESYPVGCDSPINRFHEILRGSTFRTRAFTQLNTTYAPKMYSYRVV